MVKPSDQTTLSPEQEKRLRSLLDTKRQVDCGLARIGGDYPNLDDQIVSFFALAIATARAEGAEAKLKQSIAVINKLGKDFEWLEGTIGGNVLDRVISALKESNPL